MADGVTLELHGITREFPGVRALDDVDLDLRGGEVHGLVGQNGAGKSTLVRLIAGADRPDSGGMSFLGQELRSSSVHDHARLGIATIYQEPNIVPHLTALENVFLGSPVARFGVKSSRRMRQEFHRVQHSLQSRIDPDALAKDLSLADWQVIEIARAVRKRSRLLILDEPTSSLSEQDRAHLFALISRLRDDGVTILYISHFLQEVLDLSDRITVMRDGKVISTRPAIQESTAALIRKMTDDAESVLTKRRRRPKRTGAALMRLSGLCVDGRLQDVNLDIYPGEVVGLAGLVGSGRSEVLRAIAGALRPGRGRLELQGRRVPWPRTPHMAARLGIGFVPEDRKSEGFVKSLTAAENVVSSDIRSTATFGVVRKRLTQRRARPVMQKVAFDPNRSASRVEVLSGGNQQKIVIGRSLHRRPSVLLLDEPTRGIDVRAKQEIYSVIADLAQQGIGVLLVSDEFEELVELSDRVLVLAAGGIRGNLSAEEATPDRILDICFGEAAHES